ncbi:MAG: GntR family transcriptional regulator [Planctomycetota bacterium]
MSTSRQTARPAGNGKRFSKRDRVMDAITRGIVEGDYPPGTQLPLRAELGERLGVTTVTLQQAFDQLKADGFVVTRGRWGTFVADAPPCFHRIALAFPGRPSDPARWSLFWHALTEAAARLEHAQDIRLAFYHDVEAPPESEGASALLADMQARRVGGVIFAQPPYAFIGTELLADDGLPRVALMSEPNEHFPHVAAVYPDIDAFYERAADHLAAEGRRRIALVTLPRREGADAAALRTALGRHGLSLAPQRVLTAPLETPQATGNLIRLLMSQPVDERPDGVIIADDHLSPYEASGFLAAGVRVPEEVGVVTFCNFPHRGGDILPVARFGYSAEAVLGACLERFREFRAGRPVARKTRILPITEEEWRETVRPHPAETYRDTPANDAVRHPGEAG